MIWWIAGAWLLLQVPFGIAVGRMLARSAEGDLDE